MAFARSSNSRCTLCSALEEGKLQAVNAQLEPLVATLRSTGELPSASNPTLIEIAHGLGLNANSVRFHVKECLVQADIQDQRVSELRDLASAVQVAKLAYESEPDKPQLANAYVALLREFRDLSKDVEGQIDPETTVTYMVGNVVSPLAKDVVLLASEQLHELVAALGKTVPKEQLPVIVSQLKAFLTRLGTKVAERQHQSIVAVSKYYKVQLAAADTRKSVLGDVTDARASLDEAVAQQRKSTTEPAKPTTSHATSRTPTAH